MKKQSLLDLPIETIRQVLKGAVMRDIDLTEFFTALYFSVKLSVSIRQLESTLTEMDKVKLSESTIETIRQTLLETSRDERIKQVIEQFLRQK